jgi:hypothetical protein
LRVKLNVDSLKLYDHGAILRATTNSLNAVWESVFRRIVVWQQTDDTDGKDVLFIRISAKFYDLKSLEALVNAGLVLFSLEELSFPVVIHLGVDETTSTITKTIPTSSVLGTTLPPLITTTFATSDGDNLELSTTGTIVLVVVGVLIAALILMIITYNARNKKQETYDLDPAKAQRVYIEGGIGLPNVYGSLPPRYIRTHDTSFQSNGYGDTYAIPESFHETDSMHTSQLPRPQHSPFFDQTATPRSHTSPSVDHTRSQTERTAWWDEQDIRRARPEHRPRNIPGPPPDRPAPHAPADHDPDSSRTVSVLTAFDNELPVHQATLQSDVDTDDDDVVVPVGTTTEFSILSPNSGNTIQGGGSVA